MNIHRLAVATAWCDLDRRDVALALAIAVFAELDVLLSPDWRGPTWVNAIVVPAMALALAWRVARPLASLGFIVAGICLLALSFGASETWSNLFILVIAVYSAAANARSMAAVLALSATAVLVHTLRDPLIHSVGDALWSSTLVGLTFLVGIAGRSLRQRRTALDGRAESFTRERDAHAAEAIAEERLRIARELHGIVSHSLGVLVVQAGAAEQLVERDPVRARELLAAMRATGQEAVGEMGRLLGLMRGAEQPLRAPQPCLADIDTLVRKMHDVGVQVSVDVKGRQRELPAAIELSAFRIVQEGITNALKHASGAGCHVVLNYTESEFAVEVTDDGATLPVKSRGTGRGLVGMGERVAIFGGRFEAGEQPGGGWAVRAAFPRRP